MPNNNTKHISGRFQVSTGEAAEMQTFLANRYKKSPSTGATNVMLFSKNVIPAMEHNMIGKFTKSELTILCDVGKKVQFSPTTACSWKNWISEIMAVMQYLPPVDIETIQAKIGTMTPCEIYLWRENIALLWKHNQSLNDFLNRWCND